MTNTALHHGNGMTCDERKRRGINRNGTARHVAHANERWHGRGHRQIAASIRADESVVRSCGHLHTDNGHAQCLAIRSGFDPYDRELISNLSLAL